ncbi:MAG: DUF4298 domain-containing protein [Clostridia bacterium]|nr:DUF4298 domain-containing protein [Clostridia bacterium]
MADINRIKHMEEAFDTSIDAVSSLIEALSKYDGALEKLKEVSDYYGSDEWLEDLEADENGLLPSDLKRGVLSEDGIYNMLEDNDELKIQMLRILTYMTENNL